MTAAKHTIVDTSGMVCPMPVIKLQAAAVAATDGEHIRLIATDPASRHDVSAWCDRHSHTLLDCDDSQAPTQLSFTIIIHK